MRALTVVSLLCLFVACCSQSHDLSLGQSAYGDIIIHKVNEWKYGFPMMVRTSTLKFPPTGLTNYATINRIYVADHNNNGKGGYATIEAGGIGQKFVKVLLTSERGYGFNFTLTVYGRYQ